MATGSPVRTEVIIDPSESGLRLRSAVVLNQLRSLDRPRLVKRLGRISEAGMERVDAALRISLGLVEF